jgi:glycerophosphoryl diester phosphodiesterase
MSDDTEQGMSWLIAAPIAHRGLHDPSKRIYENTLSAMDAAAKSGFAMECDVQLSADGAAMVFHDANLERMCGLDQPVVDLTSSELARLPVLDSDDTVRTLRAMLSLVDGRTPVIVELKGVEGNNEALAEACLEAAQGYDGHIAFMSFSHEIIDHLRAQGCAYPLGLVAEGDDDEDFDTHRKAFDQNIDFVSYDVKALPNAFVKEVKDRGMPVISWTVRDSEAADLTYEYADQITFEGFDPGTISQV